MPSFVVLVPQGDVSLLRSGWSAEPADGKCDPLGVEIYAAPDDGQDLPLADGAVEGYLHSLSTQLWPDDVCREFVVRQIANAEVDETRLDADYTNFNDLSDQAEARLLADNEWRRAELSINGTPTAADVLTAPYRDDLWAAVVQVGDTRVCLQAAGIDRDRLELRDANRDELAELLEPTFDED